MGWHWVALSLVILAVIVVRIRLLDIPLERDEGEFAYVGQLMLEGIAPYKMAYVIKLPGTAAVYALSMALFGETTAGIHLGLLLANIAAIVLVFLLAKRWFGAGVGLVAGATYALMSLSWGVDGNAAHATQFITPAALGGILLLLRALESGASGHPVLERNPLWPSLSSQATWNSFSAPMAAFCFWSANSRHAPFIGRIASKKPPFFALE